MAIKTEWNDIAALTADIAVLTSNISAVNAGGIEYNVADVRAREVALDNRERIEEIKSTIEGGVHYIGKTTTVLADTSTTNPVDIITDATTNPVSVSSVTAVQGDMVSLSAEGKQDIEFIFNGTAWYELGSTGSLKSFAFVDTGTSTFDVKEISSASFDLTGYTAGVEYSFDEITCTVTNKTGSVESTAAITALPSLSIEGSVNCITSVAPESTATVMQTATVTNGVLSFGVATVVSTLTANSGNVNLNVNGSYGDTLTALTNNVDLTATGTMLTGVTVVGTPSADISLSALTLSANIDLGEKTASKTITISPTPAS